MNHQPLDWMAIFGEGAGNAFVFIYSLHLPLGEEGVVLAEDSGAHTMSQILLASSSMVYRFAK